MKSKEPTTTRYVSVEELQSELAKALAERDDTPILIYKGENGNTVKVNFKTRTISSTHIVKKAKKDE